MKNDSSKQKPINEPNLELLYVVDPPTRHCWGDSSIEKALPFPYYFTNPPIIGSFRPSDENEIKKYVGVFTGYVNVYISEKVASGEVKADYTPIITIDGKQIITNEPLGFYSITNIEL